MSQSPFKIKSAMLLISATCSLMQVPDFFLSAWGFCSFYVLLDCSFWLLLLLELMLHVLLAALLPYWVKIATKPWGSHF